MVQLESIVLAAVFLIRSVVVLSPHILIFQIRTNYSNAAMDIYINFHTSNVVKSDNYETIIF